MKKARLTTKRPKVKHSELLSQAQLAKQISQNTQQTYRLFEMLIWRTDSPFERTNYAR